MRNLLAGCQPAQSHRIAAVVLAVLMAAGALLAQEVTADIRGTVYDPTGAVVGGASVQVTNTDRNIIERKLITGADGSWDAPVLPIHVEFGVHVEL